MKSLVKKLATIGVSEFVLIFLLLVAFSGVLALSNTNFQQIILPPPPPTITTVLGDAHTRALLVIGRSLPNAKVRVYAFSEPVFVETTADADGTWLAAFTSDRLPPGVHHFTAATMLPGEAAAESSPRIALTINDDYTVAPAPGSDPKIEVRIANADPATSELLRTIVRNQAAAQPTASEAVPPSGNANRRALVIQGILLGLVIVETILLLIMRAKRKARANLPFSHLGKGFYRLPGSGQPL